MKPIIKQEQQDTILTSEITNRHIIVGINGSNYPCILYKPHSNDMSSLTFGAISNNMVYGNGWNFSSKENSIQKMVEYALKNGWQIAVFKECDWKLALQWLIDNA